MNPRLNSNLTVSDIDQCLPQTQCTVCGYPGCLEYANALFNNEAKINRCPPGGAVTLSALARQLNHPEIPLADDCAPYAGRFVAEIIESECIGCTLCIDPCPVDAIVGASRQMHSVLTDDCTGCELCLKFCPVDCIVMVKHSDHRKGETWPEFLDSEVNRWRHLAARHRSRMQIQRDSIGVAQREELKQEIRNAVNRERTKRWKSKKRATRLSHSQAPSK